MQKISCYAELVTKMANREILPPDLDDWKCCVCLDVPIENMNQFRQHLMFEHHFSHGTALQISNIYHPEVTRSRIESEAQILAIMKGEK